MNGLLRRSRFGRGVALLALVSSLWGAWLVVVHGSLGGDAACAAESGLAPVRGAEAIRHGGRWTLEAGHCYVCHWLRSLRALDGDAATPAVQMAPVGLVASQLPTRQGHVALVQLPARSPPAWA
jgi:hypothetical protein